MLPRKSVYRGPLDPCETIDLEGMPPPGEAFTRAYKRYAPDLAALSRLAKMSAGLILAIVVIAFFHGGLALTLLGVWVLMVGISFYDHLPKMEELAKQEVAARPYKALSQRLAEQVADGDRTLTQYFNRVAQQGRPPFRCEIEAARAWKKTAKSRPSSR